jgi:hypothetical protein
MGRALPDDRPRVDDPDQDDEAALERVFASLGPLRVPSGPVVLGEEYLRMIAEVEAAPENQDGADKTWVERAQAGFRRHYERVRRDNP